MRPVGRIVPEAVVWSPTMWDDARSPANATGVGAANVPAFQKNFDDGAGSVGLFQKSFAAGARNDVFFEMQLYHRYAEGTDLLLHVHSIPLTNNVGDIVWELEYLLANPLGIFASPTHLVTPILQTTTGVAGVHAKTQLATIGGKGTVISAFLIGRLSRLGNVVGDTYTGDCALLGIDAHVQINTIGSELELVKFK